MWGRSTKQRKAALRRRRWYRTSRLNFSNVKVFVGGVEFIPIAFIPITGAIHLGP